MAGFGRVAAQDAHRDATGIIIQELKTYRGRLWGTVGFLRVSMPCRKVGLRGNSFKAPPNVLHAHREGPVLEYGQKQEVFLKEEALNVGLYRTYMSLMRGENV